MSNVLVKEMHADMLVYIAPLMPLQNTIFTVVLQKSNGFSAQAYLFSYQNEPIKRKIKMPKNVGDFTSSWVYDCGI